MRLAPKQSRPASGVHRGTVQRLDGGGKAHVLIRRLHPTHVYGPCDVLEHPGLPLAAGERVAVAFVEGNPDDPIVLGRI